MGFTGSPVCLRSVLARGQTPVLRQMWMLSPPAGFSFLRVTGEASAEGREVVGWGLDKRPRSEVSLRMEGVAGPSGLLPCSESRPP